MDLPELPFDIEWRNIALILIGIALILFAFFSFTGNPINAYFKPSNVFEANAEGTLIVEMKNIAGEDITLMKITADAVNPNIIEITNYLQEEMHVGKDEMRKFEFPIEIKEGRQGTYSIEITADLDTDHSFSQRVSLEIK